MKEQLQLWKDDGSRNFPIQMGNYVFFNEDKLFVGQVVTMPVRNDTGQYVSKQYCITYLNLGNRSMKVKAIKQGD